MIAVYQEIFLKINLLTTTKEYIMLLRGVVVQKNQCRKSNIKQSQELNLPHYFQALLNW